MWPRSDASLGPGNDLTSSRRSKNTGLSGFVSFMKRKDAEAALREFDGLDWGGSTLRVGWSKAVPIAPRAVYTAPRARSRDRVRSRSRSRSPSPYRRHPRSSRSPRRSYRRSRSRSYSSGGSRSPSRRRSHRGRSDSPYGRPRRREDDDEAEMVTDTFIRTVAAEVRGHDVKYEANLKERERGNPKYGFLNNKHVSCHLVLVGKKVVDGSPSIGGTRSIEVL